MRIKKMPSPYSYDLRCRVIVHYKKYKKLDNTSKTFNISRLTIYNWIKLKRETGSLMYKVGYQKGHSHKITDLSVLNNLANKHSGLTLLEISEKLEDKMSIMTICRGLKKLNLTNKKKHMATMSVI